MVVDCGGGTVDITVHEITNKEGHLKELFKATGGPYGSVSTYKAIFQRVGPLNKKIFYFSAVDESFESLLNDLFGSDLMSQFRRKRPAGFIDLMIAFESRKRSCSPNKMSPLNVALPFSFIDFYKKTKGRDVSSLFVAWIELEIKSFNIFSPYVSVPFKAFHSASIS